MHGTQCHILMSICFVCTLEKIPILALRRLIVGSNQSPCWLFAPVIAVAGPEVPLRQALNLENPVSSAPVDSLALIAKGDGQAARAMGSVDGPMADASPLGFAEPATFKNRRFAELTQDWIDRRHNGGAPPGIGAAQTLRDLNMTRPRPPSGPRHAGFDGFTR